MLRILNRHLTKDTISYNKNEISTTKRYCYTLRMDKFKLIMLNVGDHLIQLEPHTSC